MSQQSDPTPLTEPSPPPSAVDPASGRIACDLPCVECEYNLRTLRFNGSCPECGRSVRDSLRILLTGPTEREWLGTLKTGFVFLTWGSVALWSALSASFLGAGLRHIPEPLFAATVICGSFGVIMLFVGSFLVMGANPPFLIHQRPWWPGAMFRLGLLATVALVMVMFAVPDIPRRFPLLVILFAPLLSSGPIAFGARCRWLAGRLHRDPLQKEAAAAIWVMCAWALAAAAALFAFVADEVWGVKRAVVLQPPLMLLAIILLLCGLAIWTRLFIKFRGMIADAIERFS